MSTSSQTTTSARAAAAAPRRVSAVLLMTAMLLPSVLGAVAPTTLASGEPTKFLVAYTSFADVPSDASLIARGLEVEWRLHSIPAVIVLGPESEAHTFETDPDVAYVERDRPQEYFLQTATFATNAADVWGSAWWPVPSQVQRKDPSPIVVDGEVIDGSGVVVGVVDSGINALHPDLWYAPAAAGPLQPKVLACINVPDVTDAVDQPYCDETVGHGTHVAGIVAGTGFAARSGLASGVNPDAPPVGAAPGAQLVAFGLGAGLFILNAVEALDYVSANHERWNIRLVTNSWGGTGACANAMPSGSVIAVSNALIDDGVTVLFAAGNYQTVPTAAPTWTSPHSINPKPGLIGVANYNDGNSGTRDGSVNSSSSDGCSGVGSGGDLLWTWPDVAAPGTDILSTAAYTGTLVPPLDGLFYGTATGTSMATPHVAGIVALMLEANPDLTPAQIERILIETATPFSDGISARGITGTTMWGNPLVNNPVTGFADPSQCKVTPADAAKAEAGDVTVNAKFPSFTTLATITDADLFVCRDFKRGRGLVDAYAAVKKAIDLRGGTGEPGVSITSPTEGAQVPPGPLAIQGLVDREGGGANDAPTAGLEADKLSGTAPLGVTFTILGSDADGTVASWALDFGDGTASASGSSVPTTQAHTYDDDGVYTATLTVTDNEGATGTDTAEIHVGGLPIPDGSVTGSLFIYNLDGVGLGISNVAALVTGATLGDPVPKYAAGELVSMAARNVLSADANVPVSPLTAAEFLIYDAAGNVAYGPVAAPGADDPGLTGDCTDCTRFDPPDFQIPADFGGRYYLAIRLTINGQRYYVFDVDFAGLKPIDVIGPGTLTAAPPLPLSLEDMRGAPASRESPPIAFGSRDDPEGDDPGDDTQGDLAFMDVRKIWVGPETPDTFDVHLLVDDLGSAPPTLNVATPGGSVRASVNYGIEFCLDNNLNHAAGDGLFCYRLSSVNSVTGPQFSGGVIQQDSTSSCGLADLVQSGSFDVENDTVSWRLNRPSFNVTDNGADLAACTAEPIVRGGSAIVDGTILSLLEGSTGFTAGARVIATFAQGGDTSDPGNSRPYTFGGAVEPLLAEAGGPYSGAPGQAIPVAGLSAGGQPPRSCAWSGSAASFGDVGLCSTTVTFADPGTYAITLTVTDSVGATASDTASVGVGATSGERVALFLDSEPSPRATVAVSTSPSEPSETWSASVDLTGFTGPHTLIAKWFDADDSLLAQDSVAISVESTGPEAFVRIDSPADDPSGAEPVSGTIALQGIAGHDMPVGQAGVNAHGFPLGTGSPGGLRAATRDGHILAPCSGCQGSPATDPDLGTSVTWLDATPGGDTDGLDGRWLDVAGFEGASYTLDAEFGSPMDIWFFEDPLDLQDEATGSKAGPTMPKSGTVPAGSNWAFVYIRRPTQNNVQDLQGFDDTAMLTLTPTIVPPSAPQLLEATPGVGSVTLSWFPPVNTGGEAISAYKVYRDGALVDTLPGTALTTTDDGLNAGQSYSFEVSAANSAGEGPRAGPVTAVPLQDTADVLAITSPADGASGVAGTTSIAGTYKPRGATTEQPTGNFANTHYFFLLNLNSACGGNLGYGDLLISSKLMDHAVNVLGAPPQNIHVFNEAGVALSRSIDTFHYDQLPSAWTSGAAFDGRATLSNFKNSFEDAAEAAAASEAAGGPPARMFVLQSSHGLQDPLNGRVFGSLMCLYPSTTVHDIEFGTAITDALNAAEAGRGVSIETAILVDCSFCGGFADSPLWFPGTTTTAVDSAKVVGPNRVIEVGCTWITECFGNPA
ncbi:MAG TPA: S8 family serine peptidase, partial [Candidatus Thermoplasmatota archaeon]|nr:S8 family serine peptidase [Candidatus Thermoplasmatota archaeon]